MKRIILSSALIVLIVASCAKPEPVPQKPEDPQEVGQMDFRLGVGTKLAVAGGIFSWNEGDKASVIDDGGVHEFRSTGSGHQAVFKGSARLRAGRWFVIFPHKEANRVESAVPYSEVPAVQAVIGGTVAQDAYLLTQRVTDPDADNAMIHLCCPVKFTLDADGITSVTLKGDSGEMLSGAVKVKFMLPSASMEVVDGADSVKVVTASGGTLSAGDNYFSIIPTKFDGGATLVFSRSADTLTAKVHVNLPAVQAKAGEVLDLGTFHGSDLVWGSVAPQPEGLFTAANRQLCLKFLETYIGTSSKAGQADQWLSSQSENGSWADIDYKDQKRSGWDAVAHFDRIVCLACAVYHNDRQDCLEAIGRALAYWTATKPVCTNWYYNEITVPKTLGPAMVLIRDKMPESYMDDAQEIMSKAYLGMTGTNKVWLSGNVLMSALMAKDEELIWKARESMLEEIRVTTDEGIQPDWSFHQHGAQLQLGNYGLSFVSEFANWFNAFKGTPLEVVGEYHEIMSNYVYNGLCQVVWNGYFDMSACGRQVQKNQQTSKANTLKTAMSKMGLPEKEFIGAVYYPYSDFGVYRSENWYASVRMQSSRTIGWEIVNSENRRAYFSADGAVLVRRSGKEYFNISPVWDWRHVPGVTAYDIGENPFGNYGAKTPYNKSGLVFGKAEGDYMAAAMELDRDGLAAHKSWFFYPGGIICLGAGISRKGTQEVTTAVDQCLATGDITRGEKWINHNGITYISIDGDFVEAPLPHTGDWWSIHPNYDKNEIVTMDVLDICIKHGTNPADAHYAYAVIPTGVPGDMASQALSARLRIISNTADLQEVKIGNITFSVDWKKGEATMSGTTNTIIADTEKEGES